MSPPDESRHDTRRNTMLWLGTALVLVPTLVRMAVTIDPMPTWESDPLVMWIPPAGIGPLGSLVLDLFTIAGCAVVLVATPLHIATIPAALALLGSAGVLIHAASQPKHADVGMPWVAAVCAALAMVHLPDRSSMRAACIAGAMGMLALLAGKAAVQVFVEHPQTVAAYEQTRETFLTSQGWSPDSIMARNYERRLYQPEATGWFGLSNVFGSLAAAWTAASIVALALMIQSRAGSRRACLAIGAMVLLAAGALLLSRSKGSAGAAILAVVAFFLAWRFRKRAALVVVAVPLIVLAGVIVRGLLGERLGELSILFRWFYIQGATRIFLDHPILGVGPGGFKDAYMLAKPAISPEEVSSPHSIFFDLLSTLGLVGGAWILLFACACRSIAGRVRTAETSEESPARPFDRPAMLLAAASIGFAIGLSAYFERSLLTPEMGIVRALGLVLGLAIAAGVIQAPRQSAHIVRLAAVAGALVILAHTQIEVTLVSAGAGPMAATIIALACAPPARARCTRSNSGGAALFAGLAVAAGSLLLPSTFHWSAALTRATDAVRPVGEAISTLDEAPPNSAKMLAALDRIARLAGTATPRNASELEAAIAHARTRAALAALPELERALEARPSHLPTRQAAVRMHVALVWQVDDPAKRQYHSRRALELAQQAAVINPHSPASWGLVATTIQSLHPAGTSLEEAIRACEQAAGLDPHGLSYPLKLVDLYEQTGQIDQARRWAQRALEINENLHLDPIRQLTDAQRRRLASLIEP